MTLTHKTIILLLLVALITIIPLLIIHDSDFGGADGAADLILETNPDYTPWFNNIWEPPGGETESLLFALQAAIGAGFLGYYIGLKRGKRNCDK